MNSPIQKIKERLSIEEVVSSYIKLEKIGSTLKAKCPFHNEKTPSFFISPERGSYYCFGCSAKGDIFTFVEEFEGLDFKGALKLLAEKAGVPLESYNPKEESEKERLYKIMEEATSFFESNILKNDAVLLYLKSRGLEEKTISDFRIGFAKNDWRLLYNFLKSKNFSDKDIELAGLAKSPEDKTKGMYDRFRNRVMFPISDSSGRVIAFSGRLFEDDGKSAKYLNSKDTPLFNKSHVFFGLDKAKGAIRKNNFSIFVEGQFDLVLSHQAGYKNTVAVSGTAFSDELISKENVVSNLGLINRLSQNIVLAFDADKAGVSAATRAGKIALSLGMDVKVASMREGVDPADLIVKEGVEAWKEVIKNSKHIIEFVLNRILKDCANDSRKIGREVKEKVLPYVGALDSSIEKAHFIKIISNLTQIGENALRDDLKNIEQQLKREQIEIREIKEVEERVFRKDYIERRLLGIILWQKGVENRKIDVDTILKEISDTLNIDTEKILEKSKDNKDDLIFEAEVFYSLDVDLEKDVKELLNNFKEEYLKEKLYVLMKELGTADLSKNDIKSGEILKEINEINKKIQDIKNSRK